MYYISMKTICLLLILSFFFISKNLSAQDGIVLKRTNKPIKLNLKIEKVTKDSLFYTIVNKKNKGVKKLALREVRSYSILDKKIKKVIVYNVPLASSLVKARIDIPDPNAEYIRDHVKSNISYSKEEFSEGYIINLNKDTMKCLLKKNELKKMDNYLFIVALHNDSVITLYEPKDILSYYRDGEMYKSYHSNKDSTDTFFFIKQINTGTAELYERFPIPSDFKLAYFARLQGTENFIYVPAPEKKEWEKDDPEYTLYQHAATGSSTYRSAAYEEEFKTSLSDLLKDCPKLKYKILNETYKAEDVKFIISEYNKCLK